ncbi:hypothetical protein ABIE63_002688 [Limibacillus sp. MBR-115]|jgi:hypothetical protein
MGHSYWKASLPKIKTMVSVGLILGLVSACSIQRAETASKAKQELIGMSKADILSCMGPSQASQQEGSLEVWSYASGGGVDTVGSGYAAGSATATSSGGSVFSQGSGYGFGSSTSRVRYCIVNIAFDGGFVKSVNYVGRTGGLLTQGEQCVYAVQNCLSN